MITLLPLLSMATAQAALPEGRYALELDVATDVRLPVVGWQRVVTRSVLLVQVDGEGAQVRHQQDLCGVEVIGGKPATTVIPQAFIAAYPQQSYAVQLEPAGLGWSLMADMGPTYVGYDPTRSGGTLPEEATDAVVDFEGDGRPGATVLLEVPVLGTIELYIVQHAHTRLLGVIADGRASGRVDVQTLDQNTIGATHRLFMGERPVRVVDEASRFRMEPLESDAGCTDVVSALKGAGA
jgi:hypothetical protein